MTESGLFHAQFLTKSRRRRRIAARERTTGFFVAQISKICRIAELHSAGRDSVGVGWTCRSLADCKSAIQQDAILRYKIGNCALPTPSVDDYGPSPELRCFGYASSALYPVIRQIGNLSVTTPLVWGSAGRRPAVFGGPPNTSSIHLGSHLWRE
jgi:hypothetical protein